MEHYSGKSLSQFRNEVGVKFQLYNSLFTSLPFHRIEKTGILLSLLASNCEEGFRKGLSPIEILEEFFSRHTTYEKQKDRLDLLFRFVQYLERQVVLFDALEDAAFRHINDMQGPGTLKNLSAEVYQQHKEKALEKKLDHFAIMLVLTAHPTQFYPGPVLGIINDLARALGDNDTAAVNTYLQQLGKTPFFKKQKPTPFDEGISLIWYLENVFYPAAGRIISFLKSQFGDAIPSHNPLIRMGFWPGGDRDGNPFVTSTITLQMADALRGSIIKCYYLDVRKLRRRLTFEGVDVLLQELEKSLYDNLFIPGQRTRLEKNKLLDTLNEIRSIIVHQHNGLFLHLVENLINKIELFGLHFATLDIRQDSSIHKEVIDQLRMTFNVLPGYDDLNLEDKMKALAGIESSIDPSSIDNELAKETIGSIGAIRQIQQFNGPSGCNRYIISHCFSALNAMEVFGLFLVAGFQKEEINVDIVPLFETIDDLREARNVMEQLYSQPDYAEHLLRRNNRQVIMLGFSDGTKDGGYLTANWNIYKAKEELTALSREYQVDVVFFDGRGGPPSRGGGKTHKFYASMGKNISNNEIQLTIQGQTVSSNFGTIDAAQFNIEQLLHAGISNSIFSEKDETFTDDEESLLEELSSLSYEAYKQLRDHPVLTEYLLQVSPLRFYNETNIGSRPAKRGASSALSLKDLRAVPFAGSWSQLKQNVTGYFGVGSALRSMERAGRLDEVQALYTGSLFFRTLIDNCEMAMMKSFFPLTAYIRQDPQFGEVWQLIKAEYDLTCDYLKKITGESELMAAYPVDRMSIQMRERIVLPLLTIQQYALAKLRTEDADRTTLEKLAMRCSFGIINAGRNSA